MAYESLWLKQEPPEFETKPTEDRPALLMEVQEHRLASLRVATTEEVERTLDAGLEAGIVTLQEATKGQNDIFGTIYGVFDKFPDGALVKKEQFAETFGEKASALLGTLGVESIEITNTSKGQHYKLGFAQPESRIAKSAEILHDQSVEFDVAKSAESLKLDNIKGLKVKKVGGRFEATVDRIDISQNDKGETVIVGKGHWGIFRGSRTITIAADGTIIGGEK